MSKQHQHQQQKLAVQTGPWPLFRFDPRRKQDGKNPLSLDSARPTVAYREFIKNEPRFRGLLKEMDVGGGEVQAFYEDHIQQNFDLYAHMADDSENAIKPEVKKSVDA